MSPRCNRCTCFQHTQVWYLLWQFPTQGQALNWKYQRLFRLIIEKIHLIHIYIYIYRELTYPLSLTYPLPRHFWRLSSCFPRWDMLVSWRVITLPLTLKKHRKLKKNTWGSHLFGSSYRKAVQPMVRVNGNFWWPVLFSPGVWRAELDNGWGDPSSWSWDLKLCFEVWSPKVLFFVFRFLKKSQAKHVGVMLATSKLQVGSK